MENRLLDPLVPKAIESFLKNSTFILEQLLAQALPGFAHEGTAVAPVHQMLF
jgi:hypothetical protein